jgi:hypothetical protein
MDKLLHFSVGMIIYLFLIKSRVSVRSAFVTVLTIALFKEFVIDLSALLHTGDIAESFEDILSTMIFPIGHVINVLNRKRYIYEKEEVEIPKEMEKSVVKVCCTGDHVP